MGDKTHFLPDVKRLSELPERLLAAHPIDLRLWLSGDVDLGEMLWVVVN